MRAFIIACLAIAAVVADSDPDAYTLNQVVHGQTAGGVITGVDYGHGSGLVPAVGVAPVATVHTVPVATHVAPAVVSSYSALPYTGYTGHVGYTGHLGYAGLLGYNRHYLAKREADSEADSEADAYTIHQVNHGLTSGGVITGVDYGNGIVSGFGALGNRAYTTAHAVPVATHVAPAVVSSYNVPTVASSYATPAVVSRYSTLPYTGYTGHLGYTGLTGLGYTRHYLAKREADSEADAYTFNQVAYGLPFANAVATGNAHNPGYITGTNAPVAAYTHAVPTSTYTHAVSAVHAPAVVSSYATPAVVSRYSTLPYTGYTGHLGYTGLTGLGYNGHYLAKREADSEADAYTINQVAHGLPFANAVATGNAHNLGYITRINAPVSAYTHAVPTTTYTHGVPAVHAATYSTLPYTGYTGHLGYRSVLGSLGWPYAK